MPAFLIMFHNEKAIQPQLHNIKHLINQESSKTVDLPLRESRLVRHKFNVLSKFEKTLAQVSSVLFPYPK